MPGHYGNGKNGKNGKKKKAAGMTAAQRKLPPKLQKAIANKKKKK